MASEGQFDIGFSYHMYTVLPHPIRILYVWLGAEVKTINCAYEVHAVSIQHYNSSIMPLPPSPNQPSIKTRYTTLNTCSQWRAAQVIPLHDVGVAPAHTRKNQGVDKEGDSLEPPSESHLCVWGGNRWTEAMAMSSMKDIYRVYKATIHNSISSTSSLKFAATHQPCVPQRNSFSRDPDAQRSRRTPSRR